jgi:hypothetical protein
VLLPFVFVLCIGTVLYSEKVNFVGGWPLRRGLLIATCCRVTLSRGKVGAVAVNPKVIFF